MFEVLVQALPFDPGMKRKTNTLIHFLQQRGETLALAESVTAGLACHRLAGVKGACDVLMGSIVCYAEDMKKELLGVPSSLIKRYTAESQQVTDALAKKLSHKITADVCVAVTGLAADGGSESKDKPVGTVFLAMYYKRKIYRKRLQLKGTPIQIRQKACDHLCDFVIETLRS